VASNSAPFTVRAGNIYFVAHNGNDRKAGSYNSPWRTLGRAVSRMKAGDIVYLEDGYTSTGRWTNNDAVKLSGSGTAQAPLAIVAYPNATATIGSTTGTYAGINVTGNNWVLAGLTILDSQSALVVSNASGVRLAGSDLSCPGAMLAGGCIAVSGGSSLTLLGNYIHDTGSAASTNQSGYQAMDLLDATQVEVGWNVFANTLGCNALLARSSSSALFSYLVHDNYFYSTRCSAIDLKSMNPAKGAVLVYNNIVQLAGTGPQPQGAVQDSGYAAIAIGGGAATPVEAWNNTVYDAGSFGGASAGAVRASGAIHLVNNIFDLQNGEQYLSLDTDLYWLDGSNNLFFGAGDMLGVFSNSVMSDPMFVSPSTNNFHLASGSPAIDAGATVQLAMDYDGVLRPQGAGYDLGAYEAFSSQNPAPVAGTLSALPTSLSFGTVTVNESTTTTATLSNTGNTDVTISQVNSNSASFLVSGLSLPLTLGAGKSATMSVTFAPTTAGSLSGSISVASNASNGNINIAASGTAVAASPAVSLSPASLTFASQTVGTTSSAQTITLTNTSSGSLSISGITASGDFSQTNNCGSTLAASASCSISVIFTPTASGTRSGAISVSDNAPASPQAVALSGTGVVLTPAVSLSPTSLTFASQAVGTTSGAQTVTLTNTGSGSLSISSIAATGDFSQTNNCGSSLAASASCSISVRFAPTASGTRTGAISVSDNAPASPQAVTLSGTGVVLTPAVSLSPTSLTFASQTVGTTSSAQTIKLTNTGTGSLSISGITASGDFSQTNNCGSSLAASASCSISVRFAPTASGTRSGAISVSDNAAASPQAVSLSGTGVIPVAHSVAISWTENSGSVIGYNVYRSTQPGTGYGKLNGTPLPNQAYTDTSVSGGQTYYYVVTSVGTDSTESAYSSQVAATVPSN
jgi:hypothetical protein